MLWYNFSMKNAEIKVGIAGLGLIGASLLKALFKKSDYEIFCYSNSSFEKALKYTKHSSCDIRILANCDIIFVCSSLSKTKEVLDELNSFLDSRTIVADVASVKSDLLNLDYNYNFILSHPMAGTENSGFDASFEELFTGAKWLIEKNNPILEKIIKDTGAMPYKIDMKEHDFYCAQISHLPALISFLLFDCASDNSKNIASSGFRDTTRLALTNSDMIFSMVRNNEENILKAFEILKSKFDEVKRMEDSEKIEFFKKIAQKRSKMYNKDGKNVFKV